MPNYKQAEITGTVWQRCHHVALDNPRAGVPSIMFYEQEVLSISGREVESLTGPLSVPFNPAQVITLRNPYTGEPTGEYSTHGAVYALLYSAYMGAAEARDIANG